MNKKLFLALPFLVLSMHVSAQTGADTARSPVRTLSSAQYNAYLKGIDLNDRSYVAELNHYPLPDEVLKYKKELDLSPTEIKQLNAVVAFLNMKKKEVGESVILNEKMLDSLFRTRKIDEGSVIFYSNRYGLYEGEYRTVVLQACVRTEKILTPQQIRKFEALKKHN